MMDKMLQQIREGKDKVGQGYNDARGEIPDTQDIPKAAGLNVRNDPERGTASWEARQNMRQARGAMKGFFQHWPVTTLALAVSAGTGLGALGYWMYQQYRD